MGKISAVAVFAFALGVCGAGEQKALAASAKPHAADADYQTWETYGGDPAGTHYSSLAQIDRSNVKNLVVAWQFDTKELGGLETNPIIVGNVLYATTPMKSVIALNGATGKLIWKWDADLKGFARNRGVTYWSDGKDSRIFVGYRNFLYALDAKTGKLIPGFAEAGKIDLRKGLRGEDYESQSIGLTTPATIYKDLIIVGGQNPETYPSPPGDIRAFDARTGALRWTFHTIPHPGELGYDTWPADAWKTAGAANNWGGMSVDVKRGIVYVPTGSAVFDFYGKFRIGDDLFADTLLALDAETGKRIWHFQAVHHDLWDRDFSAPPALVTLKHDGKTIDAIAQTSKTGYLYVFDRTNGKPLFPIVEKPFPASDVPGEKASPTQPIPTLAPYTRQYMDESMLTNRTPEAHAWAEKQWQSFAGGGEFQPPSVDKLTVDQPGFAGGAEWGGPAVDPNTGILYVNAEDTPWLVGLTIPPAAGSEGEKLYQSQCSVCHGINRAGSPPSIPALRGIESVLTDKEIAETVHGGKGRMPAFTNLSDQQVEALVRYLTRTPQQQHRPDPNAKPGAPEPGDELMPYKTIGFRRFNDPDGYPAIAPPWGTLSAIDLNTGKYLWRIPFGEYPELKAKGMPTTGSDNYGGPIVTAGGLLFIGATVFDEKFHAYDSRTGDLLWETTLPYAGLATPSTYSINGKQYVVIAAGGGQSSRKKSGGIYVAFALP